MTETADTILNDILEDLGTLSEIPRPWLKKLTGNLAGENSEVVLLKAGLRSSRDMAALIKESVKSGNFAGFFLKNSATGEPAALIEFVEHDSKPWRVIKSSGDQATRPQSFATSHWERKSTGRYTKVVQVTSFSLNDMASEGVLGVNFTEGNVDLYGVMRDTNRISVRNDRALAKSGRDADIDAIKKQAATKFLALKSADTADSILAAVDSVMASIRKDIDDSAQSAKAGEYKSVNVAGKNVDTLNSMLYELANLKKEVRNMRGWNRSEGAPNQKSYEYQRFLDNLERAKRRVAKYTATGRFEESVVDKILSKL